MKPSESFRSALNGCADPRDRATICAMIRSAPRTIGLVRVLLLVVAAITPLGAARSVHAQGSIGIATSTTVQQMMTDLNNYGTWIPDREWGWVWQPRGVLPGWRPYSHGQWLVAEGFGMYWQSYEPFGWAVYHYGRWAWWGGNKGWVWIPDKTWGPGYVNWAYGEGYVAWTPMEPTAPNAAQGIRNDKVNNAPWMWMIVPQASLLTSNVWQWALPTARNINIMQHLEQHTVFSGVSDYSIPKDMLLAISGSGDPAQVVAFVMTPLNTAQGDVRGVIEAYAPVLTGSAQPLGSQFKIAPPTPSHAPPPPSRPMPPLPPTWRAVPMTQGATQEQAVARQQQLQAIYRNGQATRLAQAQNYDAYSPPVSAGNMSNGPQWKENERGELEAQNQREQALTQGGASGNSPYAAPQVPQSYESGTR